MLRALLCVSHHLTEGFISNTRLTLWSELSKNNKCGIFTWLQMEQHLLHRVVVHWQAMQTAFIITEWVLRFHNREIKSVCDCDSQTMTKKYHDILTPCQFVGYMFKSVVLHLFFHRAALWSKCKSHGPHACHLHISHQYKPTRFIILFIA